MADGSEPTNPHDEAARRALKKFVLPEIYNASRIDPGLAHHLIDALKDTLERFREFVPADAEASDAVARLAVAIPVSTSGGDDETGEGRAWTQMRLMSILDFLARGGDPKTIGQIMEHLATTGFPREGKAAVTTQINRAKGKGWVKAIADGVFDISEAGITEMRRLNRTIGRLKP